MFSKLGPHTIFDSDEEGEEETGKTMDEYAGSRLLFRLKRSYDDRRNTLTWALLIWSITAVAFAIFMPFGTTVVRSIGITLGWSVVHLVRRM